MNEAPSDVREADVREADVREADVLEDFKQAVEFGDNSGLKKLLREHLELSKCIDMPLFAFGTPAVVFAAGRGCVDVVGALLDAGADVNIKSEWEPGPYSALHYVTYGAQHQDVEMAEYLISRGAEIDIHAAAGLGRLELVSSLLDEAPGLLSQRGPDGQMPLSVSATCEVAELLLERGAEIDSRCIDHGSTPAQYCVRNRPGISNFLISKGAKPDVFMAAALGNTQLLETLLAAAPEKLHLRVDDATCSVEDAAEGGNIYFFTLGYQGTLLHIAARCDQSATISRLLDAGLDPALRGDYDECTALHVAAWENHVDSGRLLLARGAPIDIESGENHHNTPLGWAVVAGSTDMAQLLIESGAEIRDYFRLDTFEGEQGSFRPYAPRAKPECYREIRAYLDKAQ